ncbi:mitochondrial amidoxime reducing component 2 [Spea bombifrons]|uniref:mitochondrial amidoxime reducing component 2 n=1 Tax=Spea bombifrons TaxID=233779 RepID=UPI002349A9A8|nr:mitochondrial amidoxime reducing component 2 [Spea bombifrons]
MESVSRTRAVLLLAAGFGAAVGVTWFFVSRRKRRLVKVGEVSQLFVYPVKSCKGTPLKEAKCKAFGLENGNLRDRHWLVVKEDKVCVTGRQEPRLVLMTASCDDTHLTLCAPDMDELHVPLKLSASNETFTCKIHGNTVTGRDCGDQASRWITSFLKSRETYRLVQFEETMKPRNPKNEYETYTENDTVAYPDLSPLLLLSEASVDDLNTRLEKKVSVRNFRPNIVVSGCAPFDEDTWKKIQIGSRVTLKQVMPCPRCIFTTVDPDTGIIDMKEPLTTLRSYRQYEGPHKKVYKSNPLFGQFVRIEKTGVIKVGDPVYQVI